MASLQAGAFGKALDLLATAEAAPLDEFQRARADLLRGHVAFASGLGSDAPPMLLKAAKRLEPFDLELAREAYLAAWAAAVDVGRPGGGDVLVDVCRAIRALPPPPSAPRELDLLLDGLALLGTEGRGAAAPTLRQAAEALADIPVGDVLRWGWAIAPTGSILVWDFEGMLAIAERQVRLVRSAGALAQLPIHLAALGIARVWTGDFAGAESVLAESDSVAVATGSRLAPFKWLRLRALQGREAEATALIAAVAERAAPGEQGQAATIGQWAAAVLYNGLARYQKAVSAARRAASEVRYPWTMWALPELVEAAARTGDAELARDALERLTEATRPCGTDLALGIEARCRALLSEGASADDLYREAIGRLSRTRLRPELARAHLLYGEWLRRAARRVDAREQLRTAHGMLAAIGMEAFAGRARRELVATGEKVRKRSVETRDQLTPQEEQIAQLARDGRTNMEIGAQLFLSARPVEWHLRKIFTKLGIGSRQQLHLALAQRGEDGRSA